MIVNDPRDPRIPDPHHTEPNPPQSPYRDPATDPRLNDYQPLPSGTGRGGLIAAGVSAVLLVIALIAFSTGPATDPGTTAVIPDQTEETMPAPAPEAAPTEPAPPADEAPATDQ